MPMINKLPKKPKTERKETDMRKLRQSAYQSTKWRKLREWYIREHPVCEECIKKGIVSPAEVHHIKSPFRNVDGEMTIDWGLMLNPTNLKSLCKEHHGELHARQQGSMNPEEVLRQLDALLNNDITDDDIEKGNW